MEVGEERVGKFCAHQKKITPVWIGQGETHWVLLGIGSHVSVCAPGASQCPVTPAGGVDGQCGGVEIGQISARPGWVGTLLEHRRATTTSTTIGTDKTLPYAFLSRDMGSRAVGVTFFSRSQRGHTTKFANSSLVNIHWHHLDTIAWGMEDVTD